MNGHGGDNYWKIQDTYAITDYDFAKTIEELEQKKESNWFLYE
jgi:Glycosylphosphatidylinositol transamidase (GPIT), subunit GPI8